VLGPNESDWGYQEIAATYPERAAKLAGAGPSDALIEALGGAFKKALANDIRVGFDGVCNDFGAPRTTIQFPVPTDVYDWFFSARTGYRGQYWLSPEVGQTFNTQLLIRLRTTIEKWASGCAIEGREIWVLKHGGDREDIDKGPRREKRHTVLNSFDPKLSKVWICERQIQRNDRKLVPMPIGLMDPKLCIPRWKGEGLLAPLPKEGEAWLDIKGGYVRPDGKVEQPNKSPERRANQIHKNGWT